jgi:hypothetical protein
MIWEIFFPNQLVFSSCMLDMQYVLESDKNFWYSPVHNWFIVPVCRPYRIILHICTYLRFLAELFYVRYMNKSINFETIGLYVYTFHTL